MFDSINENKLLIGLVMIFMNIGSKFIVINLSENQKEFLSNSILRQVLIFCIAFVATRDIVHAVILTAAFVILVDGLLHEDSSLSIIPKKYKPTVFNPSSDNGPFGSLRVMAGAPASIENPAYDETLPAIKVGVT